MAAAVAAAVAASAWYSSMLLSAIGGEGCSAPRSRMTAVSARHSPSSSNTTPPPPRLACLHRGEEACSGQGCSKMMAGLLRLWEAAVHASTTAGEAAVTACKATKYESHPAYVWVRFRSPITTRGRSACTPHLAWSLLVS